MVNLTSLIINLDFIPILLFVFLYSFVEILLKIVMDDFRSIEIQQQHFEQQQQEEEEEAAAEDLIRERIIFPVNLNLIDRFEEIHDDVTDDYDNDDDDYDYDDDELIPVPIEGSEEDDDFEGDDDFDFDDDFDDDDDDFDDDYDDEEEEEEYDEMTSPDRVSNSVTVNNLNECGDGTVVKEETSSSGDQIDGLICPICFEPWTGSGTHQICCLPCGHLYGLSCIKKWLNQRRSSGKCPQCNSLCTLKDVRVLYVNRLCVADEELQKRVRLLEAKCAYLEQKVESSSTERQKLMKLVTEFNAYKKEEVEDIKRYLAEKLRMKEMQIEARIARDQAVASLAQEQKRQLMEQQKQNDLEFILKPHNHYTGPLLHTVLARKREIAECWG